MIVISMRNDAFIITMNTLTETIMAGTTMLLGSVGIWVAGCISENKLSLITTAQNFGDNLLSSVTKKEVVTDPELKVSTVDTSETNT